MGFARETLQPRQVRFTKITPEVEARWDDLGLDQFTTCRVKYAKNKVRTLLRHFGGHNNLSRSLGVTPRHFLRIRAGEQHGSGALWELIDTYYRIVFYTYIRAQGIPKNIAEELLKIAPKRKHLPRSKVSGMDSQPAV